MFFFLRSACALAFAYLSAKCSFIFGITFIRVCLSVKLLGALAIYGLPLFAPNVTGVISYLSIIFFIFCFMAGFLSTV